MALRKRHRGIQMLIALSCLTLVSVLCLQFTDSVSYRAVSLIFLLYLSFISLFLESITVFVTAILAAISWNFLFIPPVLTFNIYTTEDLLLFILFFAIALLNRIYMVQRTRNELKELEKKEDEKLIRFYNTILHSLSHELRTPIASIIGGTDTLRMQDERLSEAQRRELLETIEYSALRLNHHVENLLNLGRIQSGSLLLDEHWIELPALVEKLLADLAPFSEGHPITTHCPTQVSAIRTDHFLLNQILFNLLLNACQHTPAGTLIMVHFDVAEKALLVTVQDTGQGFSEENLKRAFDFFYRPERSRAGGLGLGLSIVRNMTELLEGKIELTNDRETGGAICRLRIPADIETNTDTHADPHPDH